MTRRHVSKQLWPIKSVNCGFIFLIIFYVPFSYNCFACKFYRTVRRWNFMICDLCFCNHMAQSEYYFARLWPYQPFLATTNLSGTEHAQHSVLTGKQTKVAVIPLQSTTISLQYMHTLITQNFHRQTGYNN